MGQGGRRSVRNLEDVGVVRITGQDAGGKESSHLDWDTVAARILAGKSVPVSGDERLNDRLKGGRCGC